MNNRNLLSGLGPVVVVVIWQVAAMLEVASPLLLPSPSAVLDVYLDSDSGLSLLHDTFLTFGRAMIGFLASAVLGIVIGLVFGWSRRLYATFEFLIEFFRSLPAAALLPPFLLFFGIGELSKILLVTFSCSLIVIVHTAAGVRNRNPTRAMVAQIQGATRTQVFRKVVLPEVMPAVATGLRISMSMALIVTVVSEMLISTDPGIGRRILDAQLLFQTADMYAAVLLTGLLGYLANKTISVTADKFIHWQGK